MQLIKYKANVVCDVIGCNNVARYFVKKDDDMPIYDSLKLCPICASMVLKLLSKANAKGEKI